MPDDSNNPKASAIGGEPGGKPGGEESLNTKIQKPHGHDVLCGRGGGTNNHIGNHHWRALVSANKRLYLSLPKRQKMILAKSVVRAIRSQNPPGRFLQKDGSSLWADIGDQKAQEKTSQALREGAPEIRAAMKDGLTATTLPVATPSRDIPVPALVQKPVAAVSSLVLEEAQFGTMTQGLEATHQKQESYPVMNPTEPAGMNQHSQKKTRVPVVGLLPPIPFQPKEPLPDEQLQEMKVRDYNSGLGWMPPQMVAMALQQKQQKKQQQQKQRRSGTMPPTPPTAPMATASPNPNFVFRPVSTSSVLTQTDAADSSSKPVSAGQQVTTNTTVSGAQQKREPKRKLSLSSSSTTSMDQKPKLVANSEKGTNFTMTMSPSSPPASAHGLLLTEMQMTKKTEETEKVGGRVGEAALHPPVVRYRETENEGDGTNLIWQVGSPPAGGVLPISLLDDDDNANSMPRVPSPVPWDSMKTTNEWMLRQSSEINSSTSGKGIASDCGDDDDDSATGNDSSSSQAIPYFWREISKQSNTMTESMTGLSVGTFDAVPLPPQKDRGVLQSVSDRLDCGISGECAKNIGATDLVRDASAAISEMSLSRGASLTMTDFPDASAVGSKFGSGGGRGGGCDRGSFGAQTAVAVDTPRAMPQPVEMALARNAGGGGLYRGTGAAERQHSELEQGIDDEVSVPSLDTQEQLEITLLNRGESLALQHFSFQP